MSDVVIDSEYRTKTKKYTVLFFGSLMLLDKLWS